MRERMGVPPGRAGGRRHWEGPSAVGATLPRGREATGRATPGSAVRAGPGGGKSPGRPIIRPLRGEAVAAVGRGRRIVLGWGHV
ncbi:hypothetical protein B9W68_09570 [Streptomyces sp. CS227]|nr:hypothetical protein B9W68_09570 [Streptomyces sp. CS227]